MGQISQRGKRCRFLRAVHDFNLMTLLSKRHGGQLDQEEKNRGTRVALSWQVFPRHTVHRKPLCGGVPSHYREHVL